MSNEIKINEITKDISFIDKIYDIVRFVDPINKQMLSYKDNELKEDKKRCFAFWQGGKACKNCISARAYNNDHSYVKIEHNSQNVYMITAVPFQINGRTVVLELIKDITDNGEIENTEDNTIEEISNALNNKTLKAITDPLTNIYNKGYIDEQLANELANSASKNEHISIILADIDHFKSVNDSYGHIAGDYILKEFTKIIKDNLRKDVDWVARFGGEEFLICLPSTKKDEAFKIVERIREEVENNEFDFKEKTIKITSSFGLYTVFKNSEDLETVIEKVDENLYKAKNSGRNRVIMSE